MAVPTKLTPWPVTQNERRMSVSGFGMGGTNGHVVLESYAPGRRQLSNGSLTNGTTNGKISVNGHAQAHINGNGTGLRSTLQAKKRIFFVSSQDQAGFQRVGKSLSEHLDSLGLGPASSTPEYLANLAHTLTVARSGLSWRASILAESAAELRDELSTSPGENATRAVNSQPRIG